MQMLDYSLENKLERQYILAHDAKDVKAYFTYLFNYLQTIIENENLHSLITYKYEDTRKADCHEFDRISNKLDSELTEYARKLIKYIRNKPIKDVPVLKIADTVESHIDGRVESSVGKITALYGELRYATEELLKNRIIDQKILLEYVTIDEHKNIMAFKIDPLFNQYKNAEHEIERIKVTKWWYMWEQLQLLWDVWVRYSEFNNHFLSKNMGLSLASNYMLNEECMHILHENDDSNNMYFTLRKYRIYLNSFHVQMLNYSKDGIVNNNLGNNDITAKLNMIDGNVQFILSDGRKIHLTHLRTDGRKYNFIKYMLNHPNEKIGRGVIQTEVENCRGVNDLQAMIRTIGFNKKLKMLFFPDSSPLQVTLRQDVPVDGGTLEELIKN